MLRTRALSALIATFALGMAVPEARADVPTPNTPDPSDRSSAPAGDNGIQLQEARERYQRGTELYEEGDFKLALIEFQRAYDLAPNHRLLYNIGEVQFQLNNYAAALQALEKYLAEGKANVPGKRRVEVEKDIQALRARTAHLTITAIDGAFISVDDVALGQSPLPPSILVNAGAHRISGTKDGRLPATKTVVLAGGDTTSVALDLKPAEQPKVGSEPGRPASSSYTWIGWAAAGALAAGTVATGVVTINSSADLKALTNSPTASRGDLDSAKSTTQNFALVTDILAGATLVTAGVTLYLTLSKPSTRETGSGAPKVRVGAGPGTLHLGGTF